MAGIVPLLLSGGTRLLALLPFSALQIVGRLIGWTAWIIRSKSASVTMTNIRHCFPAMAESDRVTLAKQSLQHTGCLLAESGIVFRWPAEKIESLFVEIQGAELIESAIAEQRGVLLLVPHFGNWDVLSLYLGRFDLTALYDPPRIASLEAPIRDARARTGSILLPIDAKGLRSVYTALNTGKVVGMLPDQVPSRSAGLYVPFFGQPALTMTFAHRLIRATKPLVIIGAALRQARGFRIQLRTVDAEIHAPTAEDSLAVMNAAIEELVLENPAQYQWEYKRFKKRPTGVAGIYADDD